MQCNAFESIDRPKSMNYGFQIECGHNLRWPFYTNLRNLLSVLLAMLFVCAVLPADTFGDVAFWFVCVRAFMHLVADMVVSLCLCQLSDGLKCIFGCDFWFVMLLFLCACVCVCWFILFSSFVHCLRSTFLVKIYHSYVRSCRQVDHQDKFMHIILKCCCLFMFLFSAWYRWQQPMLLPSPLRWFHCCCSLLIKKIDFEFGMYYKTTSQQSASLSFSFFFGRLI